MYFTKSGLFSLKVSCGNLTETYTLQVNSVTLSITNPSPVIFIQQIYTGKRFTVSAEIRNQEQTLVLENTNTIFNCSWKLADYYDSNSNQNSYVLGIFNNTSVKGKCIFQGVRVKISGNYKIVMFAEAGGSIMTAETQIYISTMQANFITLSASNYNPTAYFKFELTVKVYSDIDVPYYESVALSVSEDSGSQILGSTTANSNSGYYTFRLYFDTLRTKVLTVTLNANNYYYLAIFGKTTVNVMGEAIKVSMNTTPKLTSDIFKITVGIYDYFLNTLETRNYKDGAYPIIITLGSLTSDGPAGTLHNSSSSNTLASSIINANTIEGLYISSNLQVVSPGKFKLTVTSPVSPEITPAEIFLDIN